MRKLIAYSAKAIEKRFRRNWRPYARHIISESVRESRFSRQVDEIDGEIEALKFELDEDNWTSLTNIRLIGKLDGRLSSYLLDGREVRASYLDRNMSVVKHKEDYKSIFAIRINDDSSHTFYVDKDKAFALANVINHLVRE
jgi:hypothetical protein